MDRRDTVLSIFALGLVPLAARPQQTEKVYHIGFLSSGTFNDPGPDFREGLREHGLAEGRNVLIEGRSSAGDADRLRSHARELAALKLSAIVTYGSPASLAAKNATTSIPIVVANVADPVGSGLVTSLARPGGNVTGVSAVFSDIAPKYVELLRELVPAVARLGFLGNRDNPVNAKITFPEIQKAAGKLGIAVEYLSVPRPSEVPKALASAIGLKVQGLIVAGDAVISSVVPQIAQFAVKERLPAIAFGDEYTQAGGLMSYGPSRREIARQAAGYVAKILKGAKPADLPVEQPTRFEMVVNLRVARAMGLAVPNSFLVRADRIVE